MELQNQYICNPTKPVYDEFFTTLYTYAQSFVKQRLGHGCVYEPEKIEEKALEATLNMIRLYCPSPENMRQSVRSSFGGLLKFQVLAALYGTKVKKHDMTLSTDMITDGIVPIIDAKDRDDFDYDAFDYMIDKIHLPIEDKLKFELIFYKGLALKEDCKKNIYDRYGGKPGSNAIRAFKHALNVLNPNFPAPPESKYGNNLCQD
jgi:hypothetical protein